MELRTLSQTPLPQITAAFNQAFRDYFIPLQFTDEGMAAKMKGEGIKKEYSIGAFDGDQLVGFILHGYDEVAGVNTVYNAGTGVLPLFRGKGLTKAMYAYGIPLLKNKGVHTHLLEVIDNNHAAKKVYDAIGFQTVRKLGAYRCTQPLKTVAPIVDLKKMYNLPADTAFIAVAPSWQNSSASVNRDLENHELLGAFRDSELLGYATYVAATGRVKQCAVQASYRRQKIGTTLLQYIQQSTGNLLFTNVDEAYEPGIQFLQSLGFERILGLYEMKMAAR